MPLTDALIRLLFLAFHNYLMEHDSSYEYGATDIRQHIEGFLEYLKEGGS